MASVVGNFNVYRENLHYCVLSYTFEYLGFGRPCMLLENFVVVEFLHILLKLLIIPSFD